MSAARLAATQFRFAQKAFWRNPAYVFFTAVQPLLFLVLLVAIFGNDTATINGHRINGSTYYVPGIVTLAVVQASFFNLTISLTRLRERGTLKMLRGTPAPGWTYIAGRIGTAVAVALLLVIVIVTIGRVAYGVRVPSSTLPAVIIVLALSAGAWCSLAFAVSTLVPSDEAATPITSLIVLPLLFISGVFIPITELPPTMRNIADALPLKPLFDTLLRAFDPATTGSALNAGELAVIGAWGAVGLAFAVRKFRWGPSTG